MSTEASPAVADAPASPPPAAATPLPAAPAPTIENFKRDLPTFSTKQLDMFLADQSAAAAPATPSATPPPAITSPHAVPDPAKPAEPAPPATPAATPPAPPTPIEDADPTKLGRYRLTASNHLDDAAMRLVAQSQDAHRAAVNRGDASPPPVLSLKEAIDRVYAQKPAEATPAKPEPAPVDPAAGFRTQIDAKRAELSKLETALQKAADEVDVKEGNRITREQARLEREIERLEDQAKQAVANAQRTVETQAEQTFRQRERDHMRVAVKEYPALGKEGPEQQELNDYIALKVNDPDYAAIFDSPRWPVIISREFAEAKGWKNAAASAGTATPPAAPPPNPAPAAPPAAAPAATRATSATVNTPGSGGGSGVTLDPSTATRDVRAGKFTAKQLDEMLAGSPLR